MVHTALLIQNTIMAMLITGSHVPPARLHTIKTALHPDHAQRILCQDKDCLLKQSGCKGNRFEVHTIRPSPDDGHHVGASAGVADGAGVGGSGDAPAPAPCASGCAPCAGEVVRYIAPHHKNDRRGANLVISYDLPPGPLTQLMLIHIREGHRVLASFHRHPQPHLFMSSSGLAFNDALFAIWWHNFYVNHNGPEPYFPPSKGRTLFVEHFIASTGHQPKESWEGAAMAMGNSVKQWKEFYAPRMKHRLAQDAVHQHREWREGLMAAAHVGPQSCATTPPHAGGEQARASASAKPFEPSPAPAPAAPVAPACPTAPPGPAPEHHSPAGVKVEAGQQSCQNVHTAWGGGGDAEPDHADDQYGMKAKRMSVASFMDYLALNMSKRAKVEQQHAVHGALDASAGLELPAFTKEEPLGDGVQHFSAPPVKEEKVEPHGCGLLGFVGPAQEDALDCLHCNPTPTTTSSASLPGWNAACDEGAADQEPLVDGVMEQPVAAGGVEQAAAWMWDSPEDPDSMGASESVDSMDEDDVVITRCVPPGGRCRDVIDLTACSEDDE